MDFSQLGSAALPPCMLYLSYCFQPKENTWMCLWKVITLQVDFCYNLDPRQMICINFRLHNLYWCIILYWKLKKITVLSFSKLSFKVESAYICFYKVVIFIYAKSSDMLNKNTWGVKKCRANQKQHCKQAGLTKRFDISWGQEVTLVTPWMTHNIIAYFHKYDWLCHLATFFCTYKQYYKRWPSDKANHTSHVKICYNIVCHSRSY